MTFRVGQKIICVNDDPDHRGRPLVVIKGEIYTVSRSFTHRGCAAVLLHEVSPGKAPGWHANRFRPVAERKTDISIFTAMLNRQEIDA